jgi:simple sugar transport system ATP-binding protein
LRSPREARALGIGMVHQHFTAIAALTVGENVALVAGWRETGRRANRRASDVIARHGLPLDPEAVAGTLTAQLRQRLEIVQALAANARILLLDEPTAVLAPPEVAELMKVIRGFVERGGAVVLITHKLAEVARVADRITVLRGGRVVASAESTGFDSTALAAAMMGDDPAVDRPRRVVASTAGDSPPGQVRVTVDQVAWHAGEVIGIAALDGNGQRELLRTIAGVNAGPPVAGVVVCGTVALVPEDRTTEGLVPAFTLTENLALGALDRLPWWLDWAALREQTRRLLEVHDVRAPGPDAPAATLSGGNQQRFVLGRIIDRRPDILVAEDPTRGLDIRASATVRQRLRDASRSGACVVVHSSDLDEVVDLADRVFVLREGRLHAMPPDASRSDIGDAMLGVAGAGVP